VTNVAGTRTREDWSTAGPIVRLHIGLEDPQDLIADMTSALEEVFGR